MERVKAMADSDPDMPLRPGTSVEIRGIIGGFDIHPYTGAVFYSVVLNSEDVRDTVFLRGRFVKAHTLG
jgi:hypothetical protein